MKPRNYLTARKSKSLPVGSLLMLFYIAVCALACTTSAHALDLLNDTFSDNERLTQTLPTSARWYLRTTSFAAAPPSFASGYSAAAGNLDLPYGNAAPTASAAHTQLSYFTASNAPITLVNDGDAVTVTLNVTMDSIPSGADLIRFGFFNSALIRLAGDDSGANSTTQGYKGFITRFNPSTRACTMQERTAGAATDQLFGGTLNSITIAPAPTLGSSLAAGVTFPVTLVAKKVATGIEVTTTFNGGSYIGIDTTPTTLTFDTFAMFGTSALANFAPAVGSGLTIDNVVVSVNFTPPAPPADPMKWAVGNGDWNTTSANWVPIAGGAPVTFTNGAEVTFDDTASGASPVAINLTDIRTPASVTVNSTKGYTFSGSAISGSGFLAKSGASTLTLENANTFTGPTNLNAGTLLIKNQDALASSPVTLGGGSLIFDSAVGGIVNLGGLSAASSGAGFNIVLEDNAGTPAAVQINVKGGGIYSGILSGTGALLKGGANLLTLTQANTYSGNTYLEGSGAIKVTNPNALGSGSFFMASVGSPAGVATLEISGGINFSKAITVDSNTGREQFTSSSGVNTLSSAIQIDNAGNPGISFEAIGGGTNLFTVSGPITAPDFTGSLSLRGTSGGLFSSAVTAPNATLEFLQTVANTIWTVNSPGGTWAVTRFSMNANGSLGAEVGYPGGKLTLGANDALCTTARIQWNNANSSIAGGTLDLAGFNQTCAGLDKPARNLVAPAANTNPVITNSSATTDSTLTLAALSANRAYTGKITDGATKKVSLIVNAPGFTQSLTGEVGNLTYTGSTTIVDGTLSVSNPNFADTSTVTIGTVAASPAILALPTAGTDTVGVLVIDGVSQPIGIYGPIGSLAANETAAITGLGKLNVVGASDYDTWKLLYPGFTDSAPTADQDKDGLVNQQEYAFGLNPTSGSSVSPISVGLATNGTFNYTRRATSGLSYKVYTSTTLAPGSWTLDAGATQIPGTPDGNGVQTVAVTLTATPVGGKLFVRIAAD